MNYRSKALEEALDLDVATPAELVQWNVIADDTMIGMIAMRSVGSDMINRIIDRATFVANWQVIP